MWLIVLKGLPGTGKSTVGRALSKRLDWPIIDYLEVDTARPLEEAVKEVLDCLNLAQKYDIIR